MVQGGRNGAGPRGRAGLGGGTCGALTGDLEEADGRAHVVGDAALVAAAAVAGDGVEAQLGVVGGLAGDGGGGGRRRQQLPFEAPHGRGDALGAASEERAAQEHGPAQGLAHVLGAGLHLRRDWGWRRGARSAWPRWGRGRPLGKPRHSPQLPGPQPGRVSGGHTFATHLCNNHARISPACRCPRLLAVPSRHASRTEVLFMLPMAPHPHAMRSSVRPGFGAWSLEQDGLGSHPSPAPPLVSCENSF